MIFGDIYVDKYKPRLIKRFSFLPKTLEDGRFIWLQTYWCVVFTYNGDFTDFGVSYIYSNEDDAKNKLKEGR